MADETISTRIVANADFSALIADVHKVTSSLSKLQQQLANSNKMLANQVSVINRSFSDTLRSTGQFSTHFVSLQSDVEKFGKNLDGGRMKLGQYFKTFQSHVKTSDGLIRNLAKQQVAMQNAVLQPLGRNTQGLMQFNVHVPRGLDAIKNKTAIARQELQIMNKVIQEGAGQLINWGKNTQWAGRQLTVGLTLPLVAFGKAAADAFKQADQELVRLTKVYGDVAGTSAQELGRVRQEVIATSKELAAAYGTNFKETIGLAADIAATGKQGQELLDSVKETSRLAVLGEVDRQEAMKATLAIQTAFKQNTQELSDTINFLNAVENQTSTSLADLVEAIPKAGPVVRGLGGDIKDLALYLTAMREGGINATEGANALKSALASLINPTNVAVSKFQDFGIDLLGIVNENAGNLTGTLMTLQSALDTLDPLQKQQAIEQLFGKFQFARLNALFENLGKQGSQTLQVLDLMKASTADLAAVAGRELTQVTESASGQYKRALESLKANLAEVGDGFLTINTNLIKIVSKILEFVNGLPEPLKKVVSFFGGLTAMAGPLIMLTGVLANFFGYILKGVMHMKALFKGGEGWKYLTPEMLAAEKAGKLVEQSFYSDAKAAAILKTALRNLIDEFSVLESKAKAGAYSVAPAVTTMAGNLVNGAGPRVVNPNHPLVGKPYTRDSSHMVSRNDLTEQQRLQQTVFGLVPGSQAVNKKIGTAPQIYMDQRLPDVEGLTTIKGVSTGVVAGEAAKFHTMSATLLMQSKAEIEALKKTIAATGVVNKEFMMQFDDILPHVSKITTNAARESAAIVSELRAGKLSVEAARAKIIALNLEVEGMIAQTVTTQAGLMGRSINPTMVPTLNQPVVDPTGKSNMREMFKKGKTRDFINKVASSLGVRTSGAGYNIETTRPKKLAMGEVAVQKYAGGYTSIKAAMAAAKMLRNFSRRSSMIGGLRVPNLRKGSSSGPSTISAAEDGVGLSFGQLYKRNSKVYTDPENIAYGITPTAQGDVLAHALTPGFLQRTKGLKTSGSSPMIPSEELSKFGISSSTKKPYALALPSQFIKTSQIFNDNLKTGTATSAMFRPATGSDMMSLLLFLKDQGVPPRQATLIAGRAAEVLNQKILSHKGLINEAMFGKFVNNASVRAISSGYRPSMVRVTNPMGSDMHSRNLGLHRAAFKNGVEQLPGYGGGDQIPALLEAGESVVTKTATRGNAGALTLMNAGYNLDGMMGLQSGAVEVKKYKNGIVAEARQKGFFGQGLTRPRVEGGMSPMAGMGVGMGMQVVGSMIPGPAGTAMQLASILPMIAPGGLTKVLGIIPKILTGFTSMTKIISVVRTGLVLLTRALPGGIAIAAIYGLVKAFQSFKKAQEDAKKESMALNGISATGAKEVGIQYKTISERIKEAREEQKLLADQSKAKFESYTASGVSGISLTIKQLRELKDQVKTSMPETLSILNNMDSSGVNKWASNLKAQMIAGGKSVQEATNLIYALIESSDKAGQGLGAIIGKSFTAIIDKGTAADFVIKNLSENMDNLSQIDPQAFASNVDTAISSLDSAVKALVGTKDSTGKILDESAAIVIIMEKMTTLNVKNKQIGEEVFKVLKSQRPELAFILNKNDTIGGMYAKQRLLVQGITLDLRKLNSEQAQQLAVFVAGLDSAAANALASNGTVKGLEGARAVLDDLNKKYKTANSSSKNATKGTKELSKEAIKAINDEIKAIRARAEAKKKALQDNLDSENTELELQKLQLEYQSALARGDQDAAAQAQISMQQLSKQFQVKKAMDKIDENAKKEEDVQQNKLDANQKVIDKNATTAASSAKSADKIKGQIDTIGSLGNKLTDAAKKLALAVTDDEKNQFNKELSVALREISEAAKKDPKVMEAYKDLFVNDGKTKDKEGLAIPKSISEAKKSFDYITGKPINIPEGEGLTKIKELSGSMKSFALDITGGKTLSNIYDILSKGADKSISVSSEELTSSLNSRKFKDNINETELRKGFTDKNGLKDDARELIIRANKLQAGDTFKYDGVTYVVKDGYDKVMSDPRAVRKAMGGYIPRAVTGISGMTTSQPYLVGERGPELFVPSAGGQIIPNNVLSASYNIPSNSINSAPGGANNSYNNNTYTIDIQLNGTNVTANDIMMKFKQELALINAKEGRMRVIGA